MYTVKWRYRGNCASQRYASSGGAERKAQFLHTVDGATDITITPPNGKAEAVPNYKTQSAEEILAAMQKKVDKTKDDPEAAWAKAMQNKRKGF